MSLEDDRRYRALIREVLMREWDPIGVRDTAKAQDEYDSYVEDIRVMLAHGGASTDDLAHRLAEIVVHEMGLELTNEHQRRCMATAKALIALVQ